MTQDTQHIYDIVDKALLGNGLTVEEATVLYGVDPHSKESYYIQWAGKKLTTEAAGNIAEIHAQIGLNGSPCPKNCKFCSFAICNGVRKGRLEVSKEDVIEYSKIYEEAGANLMLILTTATYKFEKLLEMANVIRNTVSKDMPLLANTGDMTYEQAKQLKEAGIDGIYHVPRLREGIDTDIPFMNRLETVKNAYKAGLTLSTCLEPIGPEHTPRELAEMTELIDSIKPISSGAGKRITVPGTEMEPRGMITEVAQALYVAVYRLAVGKELRLNCSAASPLSANAGANLAWAEMGTNPRDLKTKTENGGRGSSMEETQKLFMSAGYKILEGPSQGWRLDKPDETQIARAEAAIKRYSEHPLNMGE